MTYCSRELADMGVDALLLEWRKWRRAMHLTCAEAGAMAGVTRDWLHRVEVGDAQPSAATRAKLVALMQRWDESMRPAKKVDRRGGRRVKKGTP